MSSNITAHDLKTLATVFQCFETPPKIDYDKLMTAMGWSSKGTAQSTWCNLKKKIIAWKHAEGDTDDTPLVVNGKGRGRKRKREGAGGDEDKQRTDSLSPAPKTGARKSKPQTRVDDIHAGSDDELTQAMIIPPRPIKRARKSKVESKPKDETNKKSVKWELPSDDGLSEKEEAAEGEHGGAKSEGAKAKSEMARKNKETERERGKEPNVADDEDDVGDGFLKELNAYAANAGAS